MRTLEQILEEMQRLPTKPDDITHQIADDLLTEALKACAYLTTPPRLALVQAIISAYHQIEKWYA